MTQMTLGGFFEQQEQVCKKYNLPMQPPEALVAVALDTLSENPIYGTRIQLPEDGTISWFIHCGQHSADSDFYKPLHTSHLVELLPNVIKYLYLPEGTEFIIDRNGYEDVWLSEAEKK